VQAARKMADNARFDTSLQKTQGRLTYDQLTEKK
jgi:hypothetical protein